MRTVGQAGRQHSGCNPAYLSLVHLKGLAGQRLGPCPQEAEASGHCLRSLGASLTLASQGSRTCLQVTCGLGVI